MTGSQSRAATGPQPRAVATGPQRQAARPDPSEPRLPWEAEDSPWGEESPWDEEEPPRKQRERRRSGDTLDGRRGEETLRRLRSEATRVEDPGPSAARRTVGPLLTAMRERNWITGLVIPMVAAVTVGIAVVLVAGANGSGGPAPSAGSAGFPPARDASADFTAPAALTGTLSQVAASGQTVVAIGTRPGPPVPLTRFFVSRDGGQTWRLATVGGSPQAGPAPTQVAGGPRGWAAVGPGPAFTSPNGSSWTPSTALPLEPGDKVTTLTATASGFIAGGENAPGGRTQAAPVVWTSSSGQSWQRIQLRLKSAAGQALGVTHLAASGGTAVMTTAVAGGGSAAWRSVNGGTSWSGVTVPVGAGEGVIAGLAPLKAGFAAVRPAGGGATVYTSADGTTWRQSAKLATASGAPLTLGPVGGSPAGAVVTGEANGLVIAFISADGTAWSGTDPVNSAAADQVSGVTLTGGARAVLAGTSPGNAAASGNGAAGAQPALAVIGAQGGPDRVNLAAVAGATSSAAQVGAIASSAGTEVAAGSAGGEPAAWTSPDGGSTWTRAAGLTARAGGGELTSVARGSAGWLAVGGAVSQPGQPAGGPPLVEGSASGTTWNAEDGEGAFAGNGLVTSAAAAGPAGYVIVGRQSVNGQSSAAAWYSRSLTGWATAGDAQPGALQGSGDRQMNAVTATARGFTAVGSAGNRPAAWRSADGRTWSEATLPLPSGASGATLGFVAANGESVTAAGTATTAAGQPVPFTATSADGGASWSLGVLPLPQGGGAASVTALTAAGGGFTATGTFGQTVIVWTKAGPSVPWTEATPDVRGLSGPGTQEITALTSSGTTLTGVGFSATASAESPTLWQAPVRS